MTLYEKNSLIDLVINRVKSDLDDCNISRNKLIQSIIKEMIFKPMIYGHDISRDSNTKRAIDDLVKITDKSEFTKHIPYDADAFVLINCKFKELESNINELNAIKTDLQREAINYFLSGDNNEST